MSSPRMMSRPLALKELNLKDYDYKLIGEIVVMSGFVERQLKELPLRLISLPLDTAAEAFTAHLGVKSLCDMSLALLPDVEYGDFFGIGDDIEERLRDAVKKSLNAFDRRNRLFHGPMVPFKGGKSGTWRLTARGKIKPQSELVDRAFIKKLLNDFICCNLDFHSSFAILAGGRRLLERERQQSQSHNPDQPTNPQK